MKIRSNFPLRLSVEDISLQTLLETKRLVTENVISAAEKTRSMALEIQNQLDGKIRFIFLNKIDSVV